MVLILAFSTQGISDVLIPDTTIPITRLTPGPPIAVKDDIAISEIMYATDSSGSPQWIELHNRSTGKVSLQGWEVTIENHPKDASVLATTLTFTLDAKILRGNQVLLLVTEQGHNAGISIARGNALADRVVVLKDLVGGTPGYRLLSQTAFKVTLTVPPTPGTEPETSGDIAGNLGAIPNWKLPLSEGIRSSIIRRYNSTTEELHDGVKADRWELAAEKDYHRHRTTYYGHRSDHGTPGYREADPLPVELSSFRPVRERLSGTVVITWITESEVSNAGFNIKRSTTKDSGFKVINSTVIRGAGTTDEKQIYTYTDTTAKSEGRLLLPS